MIMDDATKQNIKDILLLSGLIILLGYMVMLFFG